MYTLSECGLEQEQEQTLIDKGIAIDINRDKEGHDEHWWVPDLVFERIGQWHDSKHAYTFEELLQRLDEA